VSDLSFDLIQLAIISKRSRFDKLYFTVTWLQKNSKNKIKSSVIIDKQL